MTYYSQFGEDRWICEQFVLPEKGVYVDVGAGHPTTISNTAFLRDRGWTGLAVDGNPNYVQLWAGLPFEAAVVSGIPDVRFEIDGNPDMSRVRTGEPNVHTVTLESLLIKHQIGIIDFLSLDVEAHEFDVLMSMNLQAHKPRIVVSEYSTLNIGEDMRVRDFLVAQGYEVVCKTIANFILIDPKVVKRIH
jgi:FkbM family methyltransferase